MFTGSKDEDVDILRDHCPVCHTVLASPTPAPGTQGDSWDFESWKEPTWLARQIFSFLSQQTWEGCPREGTEVEKPKVWFPAHICRVLVSGFTSRQSLCSREKAHKWPVVSSHTFSHPDLHEDEGQSWRLSHLISISVSLSVKDEFIAFSSSLSAVSPLPEVPVRRWNIYELRASLYQSLPSRMMWEAAWFLTHSNHFFLWWRQ